MHQKSRLPRDDVPAVAGGNADFNAAESRIWRRNDFLAPDKTVTGFVGISLPLPRCGPFAACPVQGEAVLCHPIGHETQAKLLIAGRRGAYRAERRTENDGQDGQCHRGFEKGETSALHGVSSPGRTRVTAPRVFPRKIARPVAVRTVRWNCGG